MNESEDMKMLDDMLANSMNWSGTALKGYLKSKAEILLDKDDKQLEMIHCLIESHVPGLRRLATLQKNNNTFECDSDNKCLMFGDSIESMLKHLQELPEEWTLVQLTSRFNFEEYCSYDHNTIYTNGLHIIVFRCGKEAPEPFCVSVDQPIDKISKAPIEFCHEMHNFIRARKKLYFGSDKDKIKEIEKNPKLREEFKKKREEIQSKLEELVQNIQDLWLQEFKCLLSGSFRDQHLEKKLVEDLFEFVRANGCIEMSNKVQHILISAIRAENYMTNKDLRKIVKYCFPNDLALQKKILAFLTEKKVQKHAERNPLILILDDALECFPWESMDILINHPVSRLPSLHFTYALFKTYQDDIVDGYYMVSDYKNGRYIVNPDLDLKSMEMRMREFFNYWLPEWTGIMGEKPEKEKFKTLLTTANIFEYSGHGSGNHHLSTDQISKTNVKAPVFLFGCSSAGTVMDGPQLEFYGHYQNYLLAYCPCLIGMLWIVTDTETDVLTTTFLSTWIPSSAKVHWRYIDRNDWLSKGKVNPIKIEKDEVKLYEPDMLKALILAKKGVNSLSMKAACVARGIPIKMSKMC